MADYKVPALNVYTWQQSVLDKDLTAPPGGESKGDRYIVGTSATGAWSGKDKNIATFDNPGWTFVTPTEGMITWVEDENLFYHYDGSAWTADVTVPDDAYAASWNGNNEVPTKNAVYDKIETIGGGGGASKVYMSTTAQEVYATSTETSIGSFSLAGGSLGTNNYVKIEIPFQDLDVGNARSMTVRLKYGSTTVCSAAATSSGTFVNVAGTITAYLMASGATNTQKGNLQVLGLERNVIDTSIDYAISLYDDGTAAEDSTAAKTVDVTIQFSDTSSNKFNKSAYMAMLVE